MSNIDSRRDPGTCDCCQRDVDYMRGSPWHGESKLCLECFYQWYDGDVDPTSAISIGNATRKKLGLPPLTFERDGDVM